MDARTFGRFRFDPRTRTLSLDGRTVALQARTAHLLELLLLRSPDLVSRDELFAALWPEGFVEDGNLAQQIYHLRGVLESDPDVRIETVRGRGYRLVVPMMQVPVPAPAGAREAHTRRLVAAAVALAAVLIAVAVPSSNVRGQQPELPRAAATEYRLGMSLFQRRSRSGFREARKAFQRTVELAPGEPQGYAGRALMSVTRASVLAEMRGSDRSLYDDAENDALKALSLGEDSNAHAILGFIALRRDADTTVSIGQLHRAIELDSHNAIAHEWYGIALLYAGRLAAAREQFQQAVLEDPSCAINFYWLMTAQFDGGEYDAANVTVGDLIALDPDPGLRLAGLIVREQIAEIRGDLRGATALAEQVSRESKDGCYRDATQFRLAHLAGAASSNARTPAPTCYYSELDDIAGASTMLALGRDDDAMRALRDERASHPWAAHFSALYDPRLERLRKRPDFADLLR